MSDFYRLRVNRHQTKMLKYMKYIFNDHFILILMFGIGGFGLYYSELVKSLTISQLMWVKPLVGFMWFASLFIGKLATLLHEADQVFLLPKERQMSHYLNKALTHSLGIPFVLLILMSGVTMPVLLAAGIKMTPIIYGMYLLTLWLLKFSDLQLRLQFLYQDTTNSWTKERLLWCVVAIMAIGSGLYIQPFIGLIIAAIFSLLNYVFTKNRLTTGTLEWSKGCSLEKQRMKQVYTFINLFTDVPGLTSDVKRRPYLDKLLATIPKNQANTYRYLYARVFIRGTEYSGLVLRLTIIGCVIIGFSSTSWISLLIAALFLYLIGFQLVPLLGEFDYMLMAKLYPLPFEQKVKAVRALITRVLSVVLIVFALIIFFVLPDKLTALMIIGGLLIECLVLSWLYIPYRLKKMQKVSF